MVRLLAAAALLVVLPGCVAERMAFARGHTIEEVTRAFGPPTSVSAITGSSRLYVWTKQADLSAGPQPLTAFRPVATGEYAAAMRRFSRGQVCAFKLIARRQGDTDRWVVSDVIDPGLRCT